MSYSTVNVFERGQVWMVAEPEEVTKAKLNSGDRTICYTRPCVILTPSEEMDGPLVTVVPITSKIGVVKGCDIVFRNHDLKQNKIMINQVTTKDTDLFIRYMFTMPNDIMNDIDEKIAIITGLKIKAISDVDIELEKNNNILKKELEQANEYINALRKQLNEKQQINVSDKIETTEKSKTDAKTNAIKWTEERSKNFMKDSQTMSTQELQKKYDLNTKGSVYSIRYVLKKKFNL